MKAARWWKMDNAVGLEVPPLRFGQHRGFGVPSLVIRHEPVDGSAACYSGFLIADPDAAVERLRGAGLEVTRFVAPYTARDVEAYLGVPPKGGNERRTTVRWIRYALWAAGLAVLVALVVVLGWLGVF